ncbi:class I SAM-dependent methyltransferase [Rhodovulum sp. DZ06]|uniref:class I SAM-dependent methyltransferase n=1 Tax=Rhodovulum sp. DZ06 TaxID=3425126 RepID=UPI003D3570E1
MYLLPKVLSKAIRKGRLTLHGPGGETHVFGAEPGPEVTIRVHDASFDWKIALNPELRAAEAFMDGVLTVEDGPEGGSAWDLLEIFFLNKREFDLSPGQIAIKAWEKAIRRALQHNRLAQSRRNVAHHYDLGNDFYRKWLCGDMQYSCAYYPSGDETLEEAQLLKKRHIAAKLRVEPGMKVLDIGCGWGGLGLYLAAVTGAEVTGVTLSTEQLAIARARAEAAGLSDRCRFELIDYREVEGSFDRVVSVGMLEHVGVGHLQEYFLKVRDRLAPEGLALIHSISTKAPPGITGPFLRKYIFPGGYAPSGSEAMLAVERSGLWMLDTEVWRVHYATTLRDWRMRFQAVRPEVEAMYDERFARMFEFYLAACDGAFRYGSSNVMQWMLGRERDAAPLHRNWIAPRSARLAAREAETDAVARIEAATRAAFGEAEAPGGAGLRVVS